MTCFSSFSRCFKRLLLYCVPSLFLSFPRLAGTLFNLFTVFLLTCLLKTRDFDKYLRLIHSSMSCNGAVRWIFNIKRKLRAGWSLDSSKSFFIKNEQLQVFGIILRVSEMIKVTSSFSEIYGKCDLQQYKFLVGGKWPQR